MLLYTQCQNILFLFSLSTSQFLHLFFSANVLLYVNIICIWWPLKTWKPIPCTHSKSLCVRHVNLFTYYSIDLSAFSCCSLQAPVYWQRNAEKRHRLNIRLAGHRFTASCLFTFCWFTRHPNRPHRAYKKKSERIEWHDNQITAIVYASVCLSICLCQLVNRTHKRFSQRLNSLAKAFFLANRSKYLFFLFK